MKKTLLLCVALFTATLLNAQTVGDTFTENDIDYKVTLVGSPNEVSVTGSAGQASVIIPATVSNGGNDFNVTLIATGAFSQNKTITSLVVEGDTEIGNQTFNACSNLVSADISENTTSIGDFAFINCTSLASLDLSKATSTGLRSFEGCTALGVVSMPHMNSIGAQCFKLAGLTSIDLPAVTTINGLAFWNCSSMTTINMPVVETITSNAFNGSGLTSVTLPTTLSSFSGDNTFRNCNELVQVNVLFSTPLTLDGTASVNMFSDPIAAGATLTVPAGTKSTYESTPIWQEFETIEEDATLNLNGSDTDFGWNVDVNSAQDAILITNTEANNANVTVYTITGSVLLTQSINNTQSNIDTSSLSSGVYLLKVDAENGTFVKKIIKQ